MDINPGHTRPHATPADQPPARSAPVMDVVRPHAMPPESRPGDLVINADGELKSTPAATAPEPAVPPAPIPVAVTPESIPPAPVPDTVQEPPADDAPAPPTPKPAKHEKPAKPAPAPKPVKPPKQSGNGLALAIVATVVIVLALSGMAVFAYLQTAK